MRKLDVEAGVEAMSLYNHVADKADVLDGGGTYAQPYAWGAGRRELAGGG